MTQPNESKKQRIYHCAAFSRVVDCHAIVLGVIALDDSRTQIKKYETNKRNTNQTQTRVNVEGTHCRSNFSWSQARPSRLGANCYSRGLPCRSNQHLQERLMKTIVAIATLSLASCANFPFVFGVSTDGVNASYSPKGGLVIEVEVESAK